MATPPKYPPTSAPIANPKDGFRIDRTWLAYIQGIGAQAAAAGSGTVTHTGSLTANELVIGNGGADLKVLGSFGTSGQVLVSQGLGVAPVFETLAFKGTTTTFSDAQIKAFPTTSFLSLVAAPGAGLRLIPQYIDLEANFTGAYTNIDPDAFLVGCLAGQEILMSAIANDSTIPKTDFSTFMGAGRWQATLVPFAEAEPVNDWGNLASPFAMTAASINAAMGFLVNNNSAGNFTGGNAANTLKATPFYAEVNY